MRHLTVKMQFGSHVYGTNVPTSDHDYKAVYLPEPRDILLQKVKGTYKSNTKEDPHAKNTADDIDLEIFSLQRYLDLLMEGQTVAVDMLFTPRKFWEEHRAGWLMIQYNKDKFLHSGVSSFAGYCRTQANKYGIKGSRMKAVRTVLDMLKPLDQNAKLGEFKEGLSLVIYGGGNLAMDPHPDLEHAAIVMCKGPNGREEPHLEVCNRKVPFHAKVKYAVEVYQRIFDEYGERARLAEKNEGIDWKALMHAVRVQEEAKELLLTGHVTFPRPEAPLLLKIRKGEVPYADVASQIEAGLEELEVVQSKSTLQKEPDRKFADDLIAEVYKNIICSE